MGGWSGWWRWGIRGTLLLLAATLSFWFSPAPRTEAEYCGTYLHLTPWAGFTANCDGYVYLEDARHPTHLLEPREVRQSRPLFILLGTVVGYPCTWVVAGLQRSGLLPARLLHKLPPKYQPLLGFYIGYVLLNYAVLLLALLLFVRLYFRITRGQGSRAVLYGLLVFLVSNQVTKAFFWTVHQQMFTFLVPLLCLYLVWELRESGQLRQRLPLLAWLGGLLLLVYGSFALVLPCLLLGGLWPVRRVQSAGVLLRRAGLLLLLFAGPTLLWIGLLRLRGVVYYNHEAQAYGQLVWWAQAARLPVQQFLGVVAGQLARFAATLPAIGVFGVAALGLLGTWRYAGRPLRQEPLPALYALLGLFAAFYAGLGYYRERLTFTLVPLLLCLIVVVLPRHRLAPWMVGGCAALWHVWQVCSYGPFS